MQRSFASILLSIAAWALISPCVAAELGLGDALSLQSAVKIVSAESEDDLYKSVTAWLEQRHPGASPVLYSFRYLADDRALLVVRAMSKEGRKREFYFETPGLPAQFIPGSK